MPKAEESVFLVLKSRFLATLGMTVPKTNLKTHDFQERTLFARAQLSIPGGFQTNRGHAPLYIPHSGFI